MKKNYQAIVIGCSAGGIEAVKTILQSLKPDFSLPIMISMHQSASSPNDGFMAKYYNELCQFSVKEARHGELIKPATVYLSVPGYHMLIEKNKSISLSVDLPVRYAIPSIDVLFESAVETYRSMLIGVILTGASDDGAQGLRSIERYGGLTIVQTPDSSEAKVMPMSALALVNADHILPLDEIASCLNKLN